MNNPTSQPTNSPGTFLQKIFCIFKKLLKSILIGLGSLAAVLIVLFITVYLLNLPTAGWFDFIAQQPPPPSSEKLWQFSPMTE
jgi:hypothetical protein